jgi:hypothetical protein
LKGRTGRKKRKEQWKEGRKEGRNVHDANPLDSLVQNDAVHDLHFDKLKEGRKGGRRKERKWKREGKKVEEGRKAKKGRNQER